jgi:hypothetical protein
LNNSDFFIDIQKNRSIQDLLSPSQYASRSISLANSGIRTPATSAFSSSKLRDADTVMNDMDTLVTPEALLKEEKRLLKLIDEQLIDMENRAANEEFRVRRSNSQKSLEESTILNMYIYLYEATNTG